MTGDLLGIVLFGLSFLFPLLFVSVRRDARLYLVFLCIIIVHQIFSISSAFFFPMLGATADAHSFFHNAVLMSQSGSIHFSSGSSAYSAFLAVVYSIFGPSLLLGEQLSMLAFLCACIVFIRLADLLNVHHKKTLLLIFACLPTVVAFTSALLREPYEILVFMLSVYCLLQYRISGRRIYAIFSIFSILLLAFLHKGLLLFSGTFLAVGFFWIVRKFYAGYKNLVLMIIIASASALLLAVLVALKMFHGEVVSAILHGKLFSYVHAYRELGINSHSRASYGIALGHGFFGFFHSLLLILLNYMFAPFPWKIHNILDFYGFLESVLRFFLLVCLFSSWKRSSGVMRASFSILLGLYALINLIWALGTTNYGTSIRHHITSFWLLLLLAGDVFVLRVRKFLGV